MTEVKHDWQDLVRVDFPKLGVIDEKTVARINRHSTRFRGGVRISHGRIWTDREYNERRERVLNTPLP
ncbi:MAG: hypothetical protein ACPGSB_12190 [Opitutales bacterium]